MMDNNCFIVSDGVKGGPALVVILRATPKPSKGSRLADLRYIVALTTTTTIWYLPEPAKATGAKVVSSVADSKSSNAARRLFRRLGRRRSRSRRSQVVTEKSLGSLEFEILLLTHQGWHLPVSEGIRWQAGHPFFRHKQFRGATGRVDFEGGSEREMREPSYELAPLPDSTIVYPGHEGLTTSAWSAVASSGFLAGLDLATSDRRTF
ncbi:MAG: MBL fold metallo-hydrolase [Slackia sp.]